MSFKDFLKSVDVDFSQLAMGPSGGGLTLYKMEISPLQFLMQAENDLLVGGISSLVNSVTNAKRAISCQMDQLLLTFGYKPYSWNIPLKLAKIKELGFLTPAILRKVSKTRNLLEHEYIKPSQKEVEESLDVATLFVMANMAMFNPFGDEIEGGVADSWEEETKKYRKKIYFGLNAKNGNIFYKALVKKDDKSLGSYLIDNGDPMFSALVQLAVSLDLGYKMDEAFANVNTVYGNL